MQRGIGQLAIIILPLVLKSTNVVGEHNLQGFDSRESFLEVFAVPLHRGAERPSVHAIGADADWAAAAAGAKRQNLKETVEQAGPLLALDQPFELRPIRCESWLGEPLMKIFEGFFLGCRIYLNRLESFFDLLQ